MAPCARCPTASTAGLTAPRPTRRAPWSSSWRPRAPGRRSAAGSAVAAPAPAVRWSLPTADSGWRWGEESSRLAANLSQWLLVGWPLARPRRPPGCRRASQAQPDGLAAGAWSRSAGRVKSPWRSTRSSPWRLAPPSRWRLPWPSARRQPQPWPSAKRRASAWRRWSAMRRRRWRPAHHSPPRSPVGRVPRRSWRRPASAARARRSRRAASASDGAGQVGCSAAGRPGRSG